MCETLLAATDKNTDEAVKMVTDEKVVSKYAKDLVQEVRRVVAVVEKYYFLATAGGCFGRRLKVHIVVVVVVVGAGVEENRCDTPNVILR